MGIRNKLVILLVLPLIIIFATNGFTLYKSQATTNSLIGTLYDNTSVPSALVLNADRDMYQALVAQRTLINIDNDGINYINAKTEQVALANKDIVQIASNNALGAQSVSAASEEQMAAMEEVYSSVTELSVTAEQLKSMVQQFKL